MEQGQRTQGPEPPKGRNLPEGADEPAHSQAARRGDTQASHLGEGLGLELVIAGTLEVFCLGALEPWRVGWGDTGGSKPGACAVAEKMPQDGSIY